MAKLNTNDVHKGNALPDSLFSIVNSKFISRPVVPLLAAAGIKNPNAVSVTSFVVLLLACALLLFLDMGNVINRIVVALVVEFSFMLDCADGQLARMLKKSSPFGAWLDKYLDRIGELVFYTALGLYAWIKYDRIVFFLMGLSTGYLFSFFTYIYALRFMILAESPQKKKQPKPEQETAKGKKKITLGKKLFKGKAIRKYAFYGLFFFNLGMGERYLYPIVFLILDRLDLMIPIVFFLFLLRVVSMFGVHYTSLKASTD
jgi:phosphatidylglycerophosphate synthase